MNKLKLLSHLFILFFSSSCYYDNGEVTEPENCITTITNTGGNTAGKAILIYDSKGRIIKADVTGTQMIEGYDKGTLEVAYQENSNLALSSSVGTSGFKFGYIEYTYDNSPNKRLTSLTLKVPLLKVITRKTFTYNTSDQVIQEVETRSDLDQNGEELPNTARSYTTELSYDASGNISRKVVSKEGVSSYTEVFTYDNGVNPIKDLEKMINGYSSPNNIVTAERTQNGVVDNNYTYTVKYTYDTQDVTTRRLTDAVKVTNNGVTSKMHADYSCLK